MIALGIIIIILTVLGGIALLAVGGAKHAKFKQIEPTSTVVPAASIGLVFGGLALAAVGVVAGIWVMSL